MDRLPCTCAPQYQCPACLAWGERPARTPLHRRYGTIALSKLAHHLRGYRQKNALSQPQMAALVGCSPRAIKNLEARRTQRPKRWMVDALSAVLGVQIVDETKH